MPESATITRACRKCGAVDSRDGADKLCSACLLEAALDDEDIDSGTPDVLMDFGDYELLQELGRGGQGVVYRARQKGLNRVVALKVIGLGHWATEAHLKRFRLEAEAAAQLDHPSIVPIYEIGERDGACFFSMKFIEGGQLDELVKPTPLSIREAAQLVAKVARTVHFAHEHGVLHRDIKPGNILLDKKGEPHLTDFGLARLVEKESNVTRTMDVLGTPSYMAPEQAAGRNEHLTAATDVYGLGAVFYHLLTGQPPFAGGTTYDTIRLVMETEPRSPRLWNPKVDRDVATICLKCLEKDRTRRYPTALAFAEDSERWLRHEPILARPSGVAIRTIKWVRRNPTLAFGAPLLAALATALAITLWQKAETTVMPAGVAVLPFENLSTASEDTLLADGLQDEILTKLGKVAGLKVISRTSVMSYRGERNIRKIGDALRVSHVLEGSVQKADGRIRVNAQLIDTRSDSHVWAESYERNYSEVFALVNELAERVATQLRAKLSSAEKDAINNKPTNDLEAYELYVRARPLIQKSSTDEPDLLDRLARGVELSEKAVARDPNFALAYCLSTEANLLLYWIPGRIDPSLRDRAEAALRKAQSLAPEAGETHLVQGLFHLYANRDFDHAMEELEVAGRLLPNNADVFRTSARIERRLNRWSEALRHFTKASELDPREPSRLSEVILTYRFLRRYHEADQTADHGIAIFPEAADQFWRSKSEAALDRGDIPQARVALDKISKPQSLPWLSFSVLFFEGHYVEAEKVAAAEWKDDASIRYTALAVVSAVRAQHDSDKIRKYCLEARRAYEQPVSNSPPEPVMLSEAGVIDAALGRKEEAIAECRRAVALRPVARDALEGPEFASNLAVAYVWLGEHDQAIEQLSSIVNLPHGPSYGELKLNPCWDSLRNDPRFQKILEAAAKTLL
ncbi:MAG: protein kinase domain-containing protein [Chthoniobacterales bacterium]